MKNDSFEPAAFVFPLPEQLKGQYMAWARALQPQATGSPAPGGDGKQEYAPVFIPVYPAYPGLLPFPPFLPANPPCGKAKSWPPAVNPFILFLILILILLSTKKEQIFSAIRKIFIKE
ncbi:MAG: hypothetical protein HPY89_01165 [Pelotomaculum sp.]|nr:hypothetical protein [Pelotomaculum sp.]